jgi:hypothetical protein
VNYAMQTDAAEALVGEITTAGGRAIAVVADVAEPAAVLSAFIEPNLTAATHEPRGAVFNLSPAPLLLPLLPARVGNT